MIKKVFIYIPIIIISLYFFFVKNPETSQLKDSIPDPRLELKPQIHQMKFKVESTYLKKNSKQIINNETVKANTLNQNRKTLEKQPVKSENDVYIRSSKNVLATNENERWIIQGDILIDPSQVVYKENNLEQHGIAEIPPIQYWDDKVIPFKVKSESIKETIYTTIGEINHLGIIEFVEHYDETDYIVFEKILENKCQSYLGKQGGEQKILVGPSCTRGNILHEIMHALGFIHEQSRFDRDNHLIIHWKNIDKTYKNQFQKFPEHLSTSASQVPFDFTSILMYPGDAFSLNGEATMTSIDGWEYAANRIELSVLDRKKLDVIYR